MRRVALLLTLVFIFLVPWEDSISTSSWGSLARVAGFGVAAVWLMAILLEGRFRKPHLFHFLVLLFFLWNFLSAYWSLDASGTMQRISTYSQIFLLLLVFWEMFQKPDELKAALQALVLGGYVLVGGTLYNYMNGITAVQWEGRYSASGVNAVDMALTLIIGLPIALHLFLSGVPGGWNRVLRWVNLAYIPLAMYAVSLTGSRTSLLAVIPFMLYIALTPEIKLGRKALIFGGLGALLLAILPLIPEALLSRLSTLGSSIVGEDIGGRVALWREAIGMLAGHPLLGIGSGALSPIMGAVAHNTYVSVATETGFVGLILFLCILAVTANQAVRASKESVVLWAAVLLTWAIGVLSLSWEFRKLTWLVLSLVVIAGSLERQPQQQPAARPAPTARPLPARDEAGPKTKPA